MKSTAKNKKTKPSPLKAKNFVIHNHEVSIGLRIYEEQNSKLIIEKNAAYKKEDKNKDHNSSSIELNESNNKEQDSNLEFLPLDKDCHFDKKYFYHKKIGFFPIKNKTLSNSYKTHPTRRELSEDKIPSFFEDEYENLEKKYILWIKESLRISNKIAHATLNDVKILAAKKGWFHLDPKYEVGGDSISMATLIDLSSCFFHTQALLCYPLAYQTYR